ncbi:hypothetical protein [Halorientalis regularis]|jgi:hypothetical protein|uniref:Uncharacterized protein n=1 Tax=Halorientalis regularis TaxID=660518 RepID=A0A1G7PGX3_9EURY|nr:hypothetical protein [Halorientalis regularis]SDF84899.1 hypothetical protein SAMN05216218_11097 [Halorientalis regularis]
MESEQGTTVIRTELFVALCSLISTFLMFPTRRPGGWPIAVVVAVTSGAIFLLADRSRRGLWLLIGTGMLFLWAFPIAVATDALAFGIVPWIVLGVVSAFALNRVVFGLVRPVPAFRRQRRGLR